MEPSKNFADKAFEIYKQIQSGTPYKHESKVDAGKIWTIKFVGSGYYEISHDRSERSKKVSGKTMLRMLQHIVSE